MCSGGRGVGIRCLGRVTRCGSDVSCDVMSLSFSGRSLSLSTFPTRSRASLLSTRQHLRVRLAHTTFYTLSTQTHRPALTHPNESTSHGHRYLRTQLGLFSDHPTNMGGATCKMAPSRRACSAHHVDQRILRREGHRLHALSQARFGFIPQQRLLADIR